MILLIKSAILNKIVENISLGGVFIELQIENIKNLHFQIADNMFLEVHNFKGQIPSSH
jgi:hypothetical protein